MFDAEIWTAVPFHFWTAVFFGLGCIVGSLLNVCIHRMPLGQSIIMPPSHCPHCQYSIPWHLNIPVLTWLWLRGRCANCQAPISARYLAVELFTGFAFASVWVRHGLPYPALALVYSIVLAAFIVAAFIDLEHFIIPDEITLGGIVAGFLSSAAIPQLHGVADRAAALQQSFFGIAVGGGIVYAVLRLGKVLFGRHSFKLDPGSRVIFTETSVQLPGQEIGYEELFYRKNDAIELHAATVELPDRCYWNTQIHLSPSALRIGEESFDPATVPHMEVVTDQVVVPREAMGLGDVKFMAAIGAFLGAQAVLFSLMLSAVIGSIVGILLMILRRNSGRLPYGPYIAVAATIWIFAGPQIVRWWFPEVP